MASESPDHSKEPAPAAAGDERGRPEVRPGAETSVAPVEAMVLPPPLRRPAAPPRQLVPAFAPEMEEAFDQLWVKIQRRLVRSDLDEEQVEEEAEIRHHSIQSMVVTSWAGDEGASSVALGLASRASANSTGDICLVDSDFQDRGLSRAAGMDDRPGLREIMDESSLPLTEVVQRIPDTNLWILPVGRGATKEALAAESKIQQTISSLEERFRYVFYDTPCLKTGIEAYRWGRFIMNAILVVRAGRARRQTIAHAVTSMRLQGMIVLGTILNGRIDVIPSWLYPYL